METKWKFGFVATIAVAMLMMQSVGFAKDKPCNPRSPKCPIVGGVAFIAFNELNQLGPMESAINSAQTLLWPDPQPIIFHNLDFGAGDIDALADQIEALVVGLKDQGYRRIGLPARSTFLQPYILGNAGALAGINIQDRHPDAVFAVINPGTPAVSLASNVFRFRDVNTGFFTDPEASIAELVDTGGKMLIIFQDADSLALIYRDIFVDAASNLGIPVSQAPVTFSFSRFEFDSAPMNAAAILAGSLPPGSLVVHVTNGTLFEAYAVAGITAGIFISANSTRHFGGNFVPLETTIPVDLEFGIESVSGPSLEMEKLGFPVTLEGWKAETRTTLYIEAYGWFANRGDFYGVHDHHLQFDSGGTRIAHDVADIFVPANSIDFVERNKRQNPRWLSDRVVWDWSTVFSP